jgi:hypothetical protein
MAVPPDHRTEAGFAGELDPHGARPPAILRTDFKVLQINEYLGNRPEELDPRVGFPFVGRQSSVKTFRITGTPSDDGYLLLTYRYARTASHIIKINDRDLPWVDIFPSNEETTHLKPIKSQFLVSGLNTLQIVLNGPPLLVYYAVVHWRALDYSTPPPQVHP